MQHWEEEETGNNNNMDALTKNNIPTKSQTVKVQTVELCFNEDNQVDTNSLHNVITSCRDEFIKVRIARGVDVDCAAVILCNNNTAECRRRERAKTIAEYIV